MARRDITGAVDFDYLNGFCAGDAALMDEVLGLFLEQSQMWGRLLDPAGDGEAWRDGAHTLKGSALGIGARAAAAVCGEAEAAWEAEPGVRAALKDRLCYALDLAAADIAAWRHEMALQGLR